MGIFVFWYRVFLKTPKKDSLLGIQSEKGAVDDFERKRENRKNKKLKSVKE